MTDDEPTAADNAYYAERAAKAQRFADRATDPQVRAIHLQMVERYRNLAGRGTPTRGDDVHQAIDHIGEALALLDSAGRTVEAAYLSAALEMLAEDADAD